MADITGDLNSKRVFVSYKEILIFEDLLTAAEILTRAGFQPAAYVLSFADNGAQVNYDRELIIKDGMRMEAAIKS